MTTVNYTKTKRPYSIIDRYPNSLNDIIYNTFKDTDFENFVCKQNEDDDSIPENILIKNYIITLVATYKKIEVGGYNYTNPLPYFVSFETFRTFTQDLIRFIIDKVDDESYKIIDKEETLSAIGNSINFATPFVNNIESTSVVRETPSNQTYGGESYHPSAMAIGDTNIWYLPLGITVREFNSIMPINLASASGDAVASTGQRSLQIEVSLIFTEDEIAPKFLPLLAQFVIHPILPVECPFLQRIFYPDPIAIKHIPDFVVYENNTKDTGDNSDRLLFYAGYSASQSMFYRKLNSSVELEKYMKLTKPYTKDTTTTGSEYKDFTDFKTKMSKFTNYSEFEDYYKDYRELGYSKSGISAVDKQLAVALRGIDLSTIPGYPNLYRVNLTMELSNVDAYGGYLEYIEKLDDLGKVAIQKIMKTEEVIALLPVSTTTDPGKSEVYKTLYKNYIKSYLKPINLKNDYIEFRYSYSDSLLVDVIFKQLDTSISKMNYIKTLIERIGVGKLQQDKLSINSFTWLWKDIIYGWNSFFSFIKKPGEALSGMVKITTSENVLYNINMLFPNAELSPMLIEIKNKLGSRWNNGFLDASTLLQIITDSDFSTIHLNDILNSFLNISRQIAEEQSLVYKERIIRIHNGKTEIYESLGRNEYKLGTSINAPTISNSEDVLIDSFDDGVVVSFAASVRNKINAIPLLGYVVPIHQYMGKTSWNGTISLQMSDPRVQKEFARMQERMRHLMALKQVLNLKPEQKLAHVSIGVKGNLFEMLGINNIVLSDIDYSTIEDSPGMFSVTYNFMESTKNRLNVDFEKIEDLSEQYISKKIYEHIFNNIMSYTINSDEIDKLVVDNNILTQILPTIKVELKTDLLVVPKYEFITSEMPRRLHPGVIADAIPSVQSIDRTDRHPADIISAINKLLESVYPNLIKMILSIERPSFKMKMDICRNSISTFIKDLHDIYKSGYTIYNNTGNSTNISFENEYSLEINTSINDEYLQAANAISKCFDDELRIYIRKNGLDSNSFKLSISNNYFWKVDNSTKEIDMQNNYQVNVNSNLSYIDYIIYKIIKNSQYLDNNAEKVREVAKSLISGNKELLGNFEESIEKLTLGDLMPIVLQILFRLTIGKEMSKIAYWRKLIDKFLLLLEVQQMIKMLFNMPTTWYNTINSLLNKKNKTMANGFTNGTQAIDNLLGILYGLEQKRAINTNLAEQMFSEIEVPYKVIEGLRPNYPAIYHPTMALYRDPREALRNEITEFYNIIHKHVNVNLSYMLSSIKNTLTNIGIKKAYFSTGSNIESPTTIENKQTSNKILVGALISVRITRVIDGDTFVCTLNNNPNTRIRILGINAPEITSGNEVVQGEAYKAKALLDTYVNKTVYLERSNINSQTDEYGRQLYHVWVTKPNSEVTEAEVRTSLYSALLLKNSSLTIDWTAINVAEDKYGAILKQISDETKYGLGTEK